MEPGDHSLKSLFDQLGLESTEAAIQNFIDRHAPLASDVELHQAGFWNVSQATFLKQAMEEDADWAEIVDQLNIMLR